MKEAGKTSQQETVIAKLNPMTKILAVFSLGLGTLIFPDPRLGFILIMGLFFVAFFAEIMKPFTKMMLSFGVPVTLMLLFIQGCYSTKNVTIIADLGFAEVGLEGILYALKIVVTLLVFLGSFYILNQTTEIGKMVATLTQSGLSPTAGYLLLATLNVVPQMHRRMTIIQEAQEARGVETRGGFLSRINAFIPIIGPVIMSSLTDAQERGMTLETRGFGIEGVKQTSYVEVVTTKTDKIINCLLIIFFMVVVLWTFFLKIHVK